jgi:hypothetical protein
MICYAPDGFNGDKAAVNAWNNARAAYSDYRGNFGPDTPAGKVVQKIIPLTAGKVSRISGGGHDCYSGSSFYSFAPCLRPANAKVNHGS